MNKLRTFLDGKKTYLIGATIFVLGGLRALGYEIPNEVVEMLFAIMGITIRLGIEKV